MSEYTEAEMKAMLMAWRPPDAPAEAKSSFAAPDGSAAAWINQQSELLICVRTMLVGPAVVIREGHHVIGTGETLEEAVAAAIKKQQNL